MNIKVMRVSESVLRSESLLFRLLLHGKNQIAMLAHPTSTNAPPQHAAALNNNSTPLATWVPFALTLTFINVD